MLRRITASLILLSLLSATVAPLTVNAAPATPMGATKNRQRQPKLAPEFASASGSHDMVRVIVQSVGRPGAAHESAVKAKGGAKRGQFDELDAMSVEVPRSALA